MKGGFSTSVKLENGSPAFIEPVSYGVVVNQV